MNKVVLLGRLTAKPELRYTPSNMGYSRFSVAVNRRVSRQDGTRETDFINCVAWRTTAEFISRYFSKGNRIGITGSIRTGSYTAQDGSKRYTTEVQVDSAYFCESKGSSGGSGYNNNSYSNNGGNNYNNGGNNYNNGYNNNGGSGYNNNSYSEPSNIPDQSYSDSNSSYSNGSAGEFQNIPSDKDLPF